MPFFVITPFGVLIDIRLKYTGIRVLLTLFSLKKKSSRKARISIEYIMRLTTYPPTRISNIITELEALGWIEKIECVGGVYLIKYNSKALEEAAELKKEINNKN